jgi:hypothetical protein
MRDPTAKLVVPAKPTDPARSVATQGLTLAPNPCRADALPLMERDNMINVTADALIAPMARALPD